MGGTAGRAALALAARYADEYNTLFATLQDIAERKETVTRACDAAGRAPLPFRIMTGFVVGADEPELRDRAGRLAEKMGSSADALLSDPPAGWIVGTVEAAAEQLARCATPAWTASCASTCCTTTSACSR